VNLKGERNLRIKTLVGFFVGGAPTELVVGRREGSHIEEANGLGEETQRSGTFC